MKKSLLATIFFCILYANVSAQNADKLAIPDPHVEAKQTDTLTLPGLQVNARLIDTVSLLLSQYEYQKAIALLEPVDLSKATPELIYLKGLALKGLSRYEDAVILLEKAYGSDTANLKYGIELARCLDAMNDHVASQQVLTALHQLHPEERFILQQLAGSFFQGENYRQAIKHYKETYETDPSSYFTRQLANCYDMLNIRDSAILYFDKVLALHPDDAYAVYRMGTLYKDTKRYLEGMQVTEQKQK